MTSPECCPGTLTNNGGKGEVCPAFGNPVPKHPTGTPLAAQNGLKAGLQRLELKRESVAA